MSRTEEPGFASLSFVLCCLEVLCFTGLLAAQDMPKIEGESLAGHKVALPGAAAGKIAVLVFGFSRASKIPTTAWAKRINADLADQPALVLYQLPVLEEVPRFIRGIVISSMRKDVPEAMRDHFVPILHGESELKKTVNFKEPDDAYLVLLDRTGKVAHQMHGNFNDAGYSELRRDIEVLGSNEK